MALQLYRPHLDAIVTQGREFTGLNTQSGIRVLEFLQVLTRLIP